jgi:hypothetical protein
MVSIANKEDYTSGEVIEYILGVICAHKLALAMGETVRQLRGRKPVRTNLNHFLET